MVKFLLLTTAFRSQGRIWKWKQINWLDCVVIPSHTVTSVTTGRHSFAAIFCSGVRSRNREIVSLSPGPSSALSCQTPLALHSGLHVNFSSSQRSEGRGMNKNETEDETEKDMVRSGALKGAKVLATQVGGHRYGKNGNKLGMLDRGNGVVLKALQNPPRGTRELSLYQTTFAPSCENKDLLELRRFLPLYYGTEVIDDGTFLVMNNIAHCFTKPNVLDLKMGRVTYDPEATLEKIEQEETKYPPVKQLGFQLTGMMIHDTSSGCAKHFPKEYCRSVTAETMLTDGLGKFFGLHDGGLRKDVLNALLSKLRRIEEWFLMQRTFAFYASSLLIVYGSLDQGLDASTSNSDISTTNPSCSVDQSPASSQTAGSPGVNVGTGSVNGRDSSDKNGLAADSVQNKRSGPQTSPIAGSKQGAGQKRGRREKDCKHFRTFQGEACLSELEQKGEAETEEAQVGPSQSKQAKTGPSEAKQALTGPSREETNVSGIEANTNTPQTGETPSSRSKGTTDWEGLRTCQSGPPLVDVRMIDFAHVFPASGKDDNYLFGLQKLISFLEQLLKM